MSSGKDFFATHSDLEKGLGAIESKHKLKYVQLSSQRSPTFDVYGSAFDIPDFGFERSGQVVGSRMFLVFHATDEIVVSEIPQQDGSVYYEVDYGKHPNAIVFKPGGLFEDTCLLPGHIHTSGLSNVSIALYRTFRRVLLKDFVPMRGNMKNWLIGPKARNMADNGIRLVLHKVEADPSTDAQFFESL